MKWTDLEDFSFSSLHQLSWAGERKRDPLILLDLSLKNNLSQNLFEIRTICHWIHCNIFISKAAINS